MPHPVYLGLTRPAVLFGVPLVPLLLMGLFCFFLSVWTAPYLGLVGIPLWFLMARMSKKDDFVFRQTALFLKAALPASRNKKIWADCPSFSPSVSEEQKGKILFRRTPRDRQSR